MDAQNSICAGINCKRALMTTLAVLVSIFIIHFVVHGILLDSTYKETASLWRTNEDMQGHMAWMLLGQLVYALFFVIIFTKGYEGKGWKEGVRYGLLIGALGASHAFIQFAVTPVPQLLLWAWVAASIGEAVVVGAITGMVYKK